MNPKDLIPYSGDFIVEVASRESVAKSVEVDKALKRHIPAHMVSDPDIEVSDLPEMKNIAQLVEEEMGKKAYDQLIEVIAERMESYSMHIRSYLLSILEKSDIS
jgi:predicted MPP superfamily phosphohydrolase